jgi:hypothetical protein
LTAPLNAPDTKKRWKSRKTMSTGIMVMMIAALSWPYEAVNWEL